jgi:biotin carboxyl carrier protein
MKYYVKVGENTLEVDVDGETVTLDGKTVRARVESLAGTPLHLLSVGTEVYRVSSRRMEQKGQYDLSIHGYRLIVEALDERARTIRDLSGAPARPIGPVHLSAPMPGLIVRVNVKEGDQVRAGQGLVVMEAMKMENELRATANGIVKRIVISAGSAVEKGAVLLEMEA